MSDPTVTFDNFEGTIGGGPTNSFTTTSGTPLIGGDNITVPMDTVTSLPSALAVANKKVITIAKDTADSWRVGDTLYWDSVNLAATRRPTRYRLGFACDVQTAAATTGNVWLMIAPGSMLYQILAASSTLTSWTSFTAFSNGSYVIPAGDLATGMTIVIEGRVTYVGVHSTDTQQTIVKLGGTSGTTLIASIARNPVAADVCSFHAEVVIRTTGTSGTFVASGQSFDGAIGAAPAVNGYAVASTAIDTTNVSGVATQIVVGDTCSVSNASNQSILDQLSIWVRR